MIPKNIYITHETKNYIFKFEEQIKKTILHNPNYKVIFYDEKKRKIFIKENYPEFYYYYSKINNEYGAMKAEIFRVLILCKYGGIYIDIKTVLYDIDDIMKKYSNKKFFTVSYKEEKLIHLIHIIRGHKYQNYFIACKKENKVILEIKNLMLKKLKNHYDNYNSNTYGMSAVFNLTGPNLYNTVINENKSMIVDISNEPNSCIKYNNGKSQLKRFLFEYNNNFKNTYHFSKNEIFIK